jgi:hypothetical protein
MNYLCLGATVALCPLSQEHLRAAGQRITVESLRLTFFVSTLTNHTYNELISAHFGTVHCKPQSTKHKEDGLSIRLNASKLLYEVIDQAETSPSEQALL